MLVASWKVYEVEKLFKISRKVTEFASGSVINNQITYNKLKGCFMKKLKLNLDELKVESFNTSIVGKTPKGTVKGHTGTTCETVDNLTYCYTCEYGTCQPSCAPTCVGITCGQPTCGEYTCAETCGQCITINYPPKCIVD
ncbi:MAG: hypothetical protein A2068_01610 [Ignavibacteria bacterium GWB2_35_6b]|nr:MAG: hypothetical protein A2068_01610 [Ignavibacteria bacterium GWB2_35_6b]